MDCRTHSLKITLVVILWYIYAHLSMRKIIFFALGGARKACSIIHRGGEEAKLYEDCMKKNKMYVNLGYYTSSLESYFCCNKTREKNF